MARPESVDHLDSNKLKHEDEMSDVESASAETCHLVPEIGAESGSNIRAPLSWSAENTLVETQAAGTYGPADLNPKPDLEGPTSNLRGTVTVNSTPDLHTRVQELEDQLKSLRAHVGTDSKELAIPQDHVQAGINEATPRKTSLNEKQALTAGVNICRKIEVLSGQHFDSSSASRTWFTIEVLIDHRSKREQYRERSRYFAQSSKNTDETKMLLQDLPSRVRIRSRILLNLLAGIDNSNLVLDNEKTINVPGKASMVFLYPFKFFVTYEKQIRKKLEEIIEHGDTSTKAEKEHATQVTDEISEDRTRKGLSSSTQNRSAVVSSPSKDQLHRTKRQYEEAKLLLDLFDGELKYIFLLRHRFQKGELTMLAWEHLWLLFTIGGLAYEREPDLGHDSRLLRVVEFHGGRRILHADQSGHHEGHGRQDKNTKAPLEKETQFYISAFYVDSDGGSFFPVQEALTIPHWDGLRHVRELRLFPVEFCQQGEDKDFRQPSIESWMRDLIERGKKFARLGSVAFKYFEGHSFSEDREQFDSPVVIDFALAKNEVKPAQPSRSREYLLGSRAKIESHMPHQLMLGLGDLNEVMTRAEADRKDTRSGDKDVDVTHNDIVFDYELARAHIAKLGPSAAKFIDHEELERSHEQDYAIFNNFVWGFVLREGVWAKLDLYFLRDIESSLGLMDKLQLPESHKNILIATVQPSTQTSISSQLNLDLIQGKGKGVKVMLYGDPGVGKTCTAEAIADYTNRPLYRITVGTLGTGVADIERNLKKIFKRGHRWGCIVLFDEADVFFLSRDKGDPYRNSIVSVFLNKLEYYSGILILTTNRAEAFDEAIMSRIPTVLYYPPLDLKATLKLFKHHFENVIDFSQSANRAKSSGQDKRSTDLTIDIDKDSILEWVTKQFEGKKHGWWNGRQIQYGFRSAVALAESARGRKPWSSNVELTVKEFQEVAQTYTDHQERQQAFGQQQRSMTEKLDLLLSTRSSSKLALSNGQMP